MQIKQVFVRKLNDKMLAAPWVTPYRFGHFILALKLSDNNRSRILRDECNELLNTRNIFKIHGVMMGTLAFASDFNNHWALLSHKMLAFSSQNSVISDQILRDDNMLNDQRKFSSLVVIIVIIDRHHH